MPLLYMSRYRETFPFDSFFFLIYTESFVYIMANLLLFGNKWVTKVYLFNPIVNYFHSIQIRLDMISTNSSYWFTMIWDKILLPLVLYAQNCHLSAMFLYHIGYQAFYIHCFLLGNKRVTTSILYFLCKDTNNFPFMDIN